MDQKSLINTFTSKGAVALGVYNNHNHPQSTHAVLNNFRSDFEDFSHFQDNSLNLSGLKNDMSNSTLGTLTSLKDKGIRFNKLTADVEGLNSSSYEVNPNQSS
tara:strand:- start:4869 stop:5177 length:309 start_codon:yes stop_codon:yes gene_type:complete